MKQFLVTVDDDGATQMRQLIEQAVAIVGETGNTPTVEEHDQVVYGAVLDKYDHCEDDGSGYCMLHDSPIVFRSDMEPYDTCEERQFVLMDREANEGNIMTLDVYVGPLDG